MKMTDMFLDQLKAEAARTRGVLETRRAPSHLHASVASSRAADRLSALERRAGAGDLRTVGGRHAVCVPEILTSSDSQILTS